MELIVVVVISAGIAENSLNGVSRSSMISNRLGLRLISKPGDVE